MMSSILEKTFKQTLSIMRAPGNESVAPDLHSLENAIMGLNRSVDRREVRNKIEQCRGVLKQKCQDLKLTISEKRLCMQIIIHLGNFNETLPWAYPFIIKFIEDGSNSYDKLLGHIALRVVNREKSPDVYAAINTLQKNLSSKNHDIVLMALTTLSSIIDLDMVPVFYPYIEKLLRSSNPAIRCKSLHVLQEMDSVGPEYLPKIWKTSLFALCDQDPHVMSASLPLLQNLLRKRKPPEDSKICKKLIYILKQILDGRLPLDMMYAGVCAPWDLIRILKMLRNLHAENFTEQDFGDIAQIIQQVLARMQVSNILQVAIASECVQVIVHFHSNLDSLRNAAIDMIDITLNSNDPNITHSAIEMLKSVKQIKPGVSKLFKGCLLRLLSDSNPSLSYNIIELLDDLVSPEESGELVTDLLKKLETVTSVDLKKRIILSILKIFEQTCCKNDPDWLIKNYKRLLQALKTDFDFALVQKVVSCMKLASSKVKKDEFTVIVHELSKKNSTPLQYCAMLEFLLTCNEDIEKGHCENAITTILDVLSCLRLTCHSENILLYSWKTIIEIAGRHKISVDLSKYSLKCGEKLPMMLEIMLLETTHLLLEQNCLEMFISQNESILDSHDTSSTVLSQHDTFETDSSKSDSLPSGLAVKSVFKTQRYSQSRFTNDTDPNPTVAPEKPKKTFWSRQMTNETPARPVIWDSSKYKSSGSGNADGETT